MANTLSFCCPPGDKKWLDFRRTVGQTQRALRVRKRLAQSR